MINYKEQFTFSNDVAKFNIKAYTKEHPSGYGNCTLLVFDVLSEPMIYSQNHLFDIRYERVGNERQMGELARKLISQYYGVDI